MQNAAAYVVDHARIEAVVAQLLQIANVRRRHRALRRQREQVVFFGRRGLAQQPLARDVCPADERRARREKRARRRRAAARERIGPSHPAQYPLGDRRAVLRVLGIAAAAAAADLKAVARLEHPMIQQDRQAPGRRAFAHADAVGLARRLRRVKVKHRAPFNLRDLSRRPPAVIHDAQRVAEHRAQLLEHRVRPISLADAVVEVQLRARLCAVDTWPHVAQDRREAARVARAIDEAVRVAFALAVGVAAGAGAEHVKPHAVRHRVRPQPFHVTTITRREAQVLSPVKVALEEHAVEAALVPRHERAAVRVVVVKVHPNAPRVKRGHLVQQQQARVAPDNQRRVSASRVKLVVRRVVVRDVSGVLARVREAAEYGNLLTKRRPLSRKRDDGLLGAAEVLGSRRPRCKKLAAVPDDINVLRQLWVFQARRFHRRRAHRRRAHRRGARARLLGDAVQQRARVQSVALGPQIALNELVRRRDDAQLQLQVVLHARPRLGEVLQSERDVVHPRLHEQIVPALVVRLLLPAHRL